MRSILKATVFIILAAALIYVFLFLVSVPLVTKTSGLPKMLALNLYDTLYRPVRKQLPYRNIVRDTWRDYEYYWCEGAMNCDVWGDEPKSESLLEDN